MKRIAAFFTSLVLFFAIIIGVHYYVEGNLEIENPAFGTWVNSYKYLSHDAVAKNLDENSMLMFGSSEFNHGRSTAYHPMNVFKNQTLEPMLIGAAYSQSLSHGITLAAMDSSMENRKVVLILSPQWFTQQGVKPEAFAVRFSESNYIAMLENKNIPASLKQEIASRSEALLEQDPTMSGRVKRYNKMKINKKAKLEDKVYYGVRKAFVREKDNISVLTAIKAGGIDKKEKPKITNAPIDWEEMSKKAETEAETTVSTNDFYILDKYFKKQLKSKMKDLKDSRTDQSYAASPEYGDLKIFLEVCKATKIEPLLVMIPVNGYWYDYTGFPKKGREDYYDNIRKMAAEYQVELADFSAEEYTPYFMEDTIHIGWKGWVRTNESVYDFFKEN